MFSKNSVMFSYGHKLILQLDSKELHFKTYDFHITLDFLKYLRKAVTREENQPLSLSNLMVSILDHSGTAYLSTCTCIRHR